MCRSGINTLHCITHCREDVPMRTRSVAAACRPRVVDGTCGQARGQRNGRQTQPGAVHPALDRPASPPAIAGKQQPAQAHLRRRRPLQTGQAFPGSPASPEQAGGQPQRGSLPPSHPQSEKLQAAGAARPEAQA